MLRFTKFDLVISILFNLAVYAFSAYSLFKIGRQNGVKHAYLAFVPILQYFVIGSICEEYEFLGVRFRHLEWTLCGLALIQLVLPYLRYYSVILYFILPIATFALNVLMAFIMHKFFYLFNPQRAFIYALISAFGKIPLAIVLFIIKDEPMRMSAGAYPYPFSHRP